MDEDRGATQVSWGARIDTSVRHDARDCPDRTNPADRKRWAQTGLIVWQNQTQRITRLSATHTMQLLDDLRTDDEWTEEGITIGEPVPRIPPEGLEPKPEPAHHNPIHLSPRQTKVLLRLLGRNETWLSEVSEEEERERSRALGRAYRLVLDCGDCARNRSRTSLRTG
jgi:transposase